VAVRWSASNCSGSLPLPLLPGDAKPGGKRYRHVVSTSLMSGAPAAPGAEPGGVRRLFASLPAVSPRRAVTTCRTCGMSHGTREDRKRRHR
jgi:hypothetical protein